VQARAVRAGKEQGASQAVEDLGKGAEARVERLQPQAAVKARAAA
jgi:hypothetical protein